MLAARRWWQARYAGGPATDGSALQLQRSFLSFSSLALLVVFGVFFGLWVTIHAYMNAVAMMDHSRDVRRSISRMMMALTTAETAQRGFLLTRDTAMLQPYLPAQKQVHEQLDQADVLTRDNPVQQERVTRLKVLAQQRLDELDKVLLINTREGTKAAVARMRLGIGREQMEHLQALNELFQDEEIDLQNERKREAQWLSGLLIGGVAGFALVLAWFIWYGLRQLERENAAEKRLADVLASTLAEKNNLLAQRELLLQEVNHRVKNSLNQVAGILRLQLRGLPAGSTASDPAHSALTQALHRISAIGRVHEQMYKSEQLGVVAAPAFLQPLAEEIVASLLTPESVKLVLEIAPIALPLEKAVPLTLVVNEVLTNAAKYAPRPGKVCELRISLQPAQGEDAETPQVVCLTIADNGPGLPADFAPEKAKSLGMRLVTSLCRQLGGTLTVKSGRSGTSFVLTLPLNGAGGSEAVASAAVVEKPDGTEQVPVTAPARPRRTLARSAERI